MSIQKIVSQIAKIHKYNMSGKYWKRIGAMYKRFGEEVMIQAVKAIPEREIPMNNFLNMLEKRCQFIVENSEMDDLSAMIFGADNE